jgi:monoamine oxidase
MGFSRRQLIKGTVGTATLAATATAVSSPQASGAAIKQPRRSLPRNERGNVVVIGGGMAGLYAARLLRAGGKSVVLLEANDRLGGRVINLKVGPGPADVTEGGAQWIAPQEPLIQGLMRRYKLKTFKNYTNGKTTLSMNGEVSTFEGNVAPLPGDGTVQLLAGFAELTAMAATVPVNAPWDAPDAAEWDAMTAGEWIKANISDPGAQALLGIALAGPVSVQPTDISLLHSLFVAAACGGPLSLVTVNEGVLSDRVVGGTGALVAGMARDVRNVVRLGTPATLVEHDDTSVRVSTAHGVYAADDVVVAMAPTMTQQLLFDPILPVARVQSVQRAGMGSAIKFFPIYETPFWRQSGLNGNVQLIATPGNPTPPFAACFDNSPPSGQPGVLFLLSENETARRLSSMSAADRRTQILEALVPIFGEQAAHPMNFIEHNWCTEPWIRGGAASFFPTGLLTEYRYLFGEAVGRVHFASTETGHQFWGNMEAALQAGARVATEILGR